MTSKQGGAGASSQHTSQSTAQSPTSASTSVCFIDSQTRLATGYTCYYIPKEKVREDLDPTSTKASTAEASVEAQRMFYRDIRKGVGKIIFVPPTITADRQSRMESSLETFVSRSLRIFGIAFVEFKSRVGEKGEGKGDETFKGERTFFDLFQDMKAHSRDWFIFLEDNYQCQWAERGTTMLGTLATIHRNRATLESVQLCRDILALNNRFLIRYREMIYAAIENQTPDNLKCVCLGEYNHYRTKINLWHELWCRDELKSARGDFDDIAPIYKKMVEYELSRGKREYSWALNLIDRPLSLESLHGLTNVEFRRMLLLVIQYLRPIFALEHKVPQMVKCTLAKCSNCNEEESSLGTFLVCATCKANKYCSKKCQKADWKVHKIICRK